MNTHNPASFKLAEQAALETWRRSVDRRRFMASRFVRKGASYWNALMAANKLFPLAPRPAIERADWCAMNEGRLS